MPSRHWSHLSAIHQASAFICFAYILDNMTVITDKQERATIWQIDLHADQAICMAGQVVKRNALAEIEGSLIERLPVAMKTSVLQVLLFLVLHSQIQLQIMLQIHTNVCAGCHRPERRAKF